jgi:hypothetical protein
LPWNQNLLPVDKPLLLVGDKNRILDQPQPNFVQVDVIGQNVYFITSQFWVFETESGRN